MSTMTRTGLHATVTEIQTWRGVRDRATALPPSVDAALARSAYQEIERIANAIAAAHALPQGPDHHYALAEDGEILASAVLTPAARDVTKVNTMPELTCEKCGKPFKSKAGLGAHKHFAHAPLGRVAPGPRATRAATNGGLADPIRAKADEYRRRADELTAIADGYRAKVKELDELAARAEKILNADSK